MSINPFRMFTWGKTAKISWKKKLLRAGKAICSSPKTVGHCGQMKSDDRLKIGIKLGRHSGWHWPMPRWVPPQLPQPNSNQLLKTNFIRRLFMQVFEMLRSNFWTLWLCCLIKVYQCFYTKLGYESSCHFQLNIIAVLCYISFSKNPTKWDIIRPA